MNIFSSRKSLLCLLLLLLSAPALAEWKNQSTYDKRYNTYSEANSKCSESIARNFPNYPWRLWDPGTVNSYYCQYDDDPDNTCQDPAEWNQDTQSCEQPPSEYCESFEGQTVSKSFSPSGYLSCVGGCTVTQSSDSECTGTAEEGGTCFAQFTFTGTDCDDGSASGNSGASGSSPTGSSSSASNSPDGSSTTTDSSSSTSTDSQGNQTDNTTTNSTTTNPDGSSTSSTTNTTTTTGTDGSSTTTTTTTTTTCDADGNCSTTLSGSTSTNPNGEEVDGKSASGGDDCDEPPTCDGDPILCAQLKQQWLTRCDGQDYDQQLADLQSNNPDDGTDENGQLTALNPEETDIGDVIDTGFLTSGDDILSGATCPSDYSVHLSSGKNVSFSYQPLCDTATGIRPIIIAVAMFSCAFILYKGVTS